MVVAINKGLEKWTRKPGQGDKWNLPRVSGRVSGGDLLEVHRIRGASVQRSVAALGVVELEVARQSCTQLARCLVGAQVVE